MVFLSGTAGGKSTPRHYDTRMEVWLRTMDGSEWSASHFSNFTPAERAPVTQWVKGCWITSTVFLKGGKAKRPRRESNHSRPTSTTINL